MTSRDFVYWLQGFAEARVGANATDAMTAAMETAASERDAIRAQLAAVEAARDEACTWIGHAVVRLGRDFEWFAKAAAEKTTKLRAAGKGDK